MTFNIIWNAVFLAVNITIAAVWPPSFLQTLSLVLCGMHGTFVLIYCLEVYDDLRA